VAVAQLPDSLDVVRHHLVWLAFLVAIADRLSGDVEVGVRPFSKIAETDPVIEFDSDSTAATLGVTTTIDAGCSVAYGPDGAYRSNTVGNRSLEVEAADYRLLNNCLVVYDALYAWCRLETNP
jgi:hypothetical protein